MKKENKHNLVNIIIVAFVILVICVILWFVYQMAISESPSSLKQPEPKSELVDGITKYISSFFK